MLVNDNKDCLNVWFFNIFFKPETELVVAWLRWSLHPLLVCMVYRPRDFYESDSSLCGFDQAMQKHVLYNLLPLTKNNWAIHLQFWQIKHLPTACKSQDRCSFSPLCMYMRDVKASADAVPVLAAPICQYVDWFTVEIYKGSWETDYLNLGRYKARKWR